MRAFPQFQTGDREHRLIYAELPKPMPEVQVPTVEELPAPNERMETPEAAKKTAKEVVAEAGTKMEKVQATIARIDAKNNLPASQKTALAMTSLGDALKDMGEVPDTAAPTKSPNIASQVPAQAPETPNQIALRTAIRELVAKVENGEASEYHLAFLNGTLLPQAEREGKLPKEGWHKPINGKDQSYVLGYEGGKFVLNPTGNFGPGYPEFAMEQGKPGVTGNAPNQVSGAPSPIQKPTDSPVQAPSVVQKPGDSSVQEPAAKTQPLIPLQNPKRNLNQAPRASQNPIQSPIQKPTDSPVQAPSPAQKPADSPVQAPEAKEVNEELDVRDFSFEGELEQRMNGMPAYQGTTVERTGNSNEYVFTNTNPETLGKIRYWAQEHGLQPKFAEGRVRTTIIGFIRPPDGIGFIGPDNVPKEQPKVVEMKTVPRSTERARVEAATKQELPEPIVTAKSESAPQPNDKIAASLQKTNEKQNTKIASLEETVAALQKQLENANKPQKIPDIVKPATEAVSPAQAEKLEGLEKDLADLTKQRDGKVADYQTFIGKGLDYGVQHMDEAKNLDTDIKNLETTMSEKQREIDSLKNAGALTENLESTITKVESLLTERSTLDAEWKKIDGKTDAGRKRAPEIAARTSAIDKELGEVGGKLGQIYNSIDRSKDSNAQKKAESIANTIKNIIAIPGVVIDAIHTALNGAPATPSTAPGATTAPAPAAATAAAAEKPKNIKVFDIKQLPADKLVDKLKIFTAADFEWKTLPNIEEKDSLGNNFEYKKMYGHIKDAEGKPEILLLRHSEKDGLSILDSTGVWVKIDRTKKQLPKE